MQRTVLTWAGGEHSFALTIGGLRAVQDATDRGPMEVWSALKTGVWRVDDVLAVLRHGLIGGGMDEAQAQKLVNRMATSEPLAKLVPTAALVIASALVGPVDDPIGVEDDGEGEQTGGAAPEN